MEALILAIIIIVLGVLYIISTVLYIYYTYQLMNKLDKQVKELNNNLLLWKIKNLKYGNKN